ncbi:PRC-barrel domain-containing protein [Falsirhodobacter sp. 20TX0035]|uniref:PRC-barrel domain-containing protein n=1 Tax=Falsirhodobacter sp. 20TX0035 TaxID=3022019 RepID=UPI00232BC598|nr:PRC-barrel domain-containing protein [Falsirhodobacter sp. 20TX0035]MDB6454690.1 PRC-barrel domain-containing protein [Falsirhodobacter sp. 20TX0035]
MAHEHVILTGAELTIENLTGVSVYGPEHEKVGVVGDLLLSADETIRSAVIDVGGFLGIGAKHVAVPFEALQFVHDGVGGDIHAHIGWTKDELKDRPEHVRTDDDVGFTVYAPPLV